MTKNGLLSVIKLYTIFVAILIAVLFNSAGRAQQNLIFMDDFSYPIGHLVGNDGWLQIDGHPTPAIMVTNPGGLTYPNYVGSNIGNAVTLGNNGQDASAHFFNLHGNSEVVDSGSIYASAMVKVTSAQMTGDYFIFLGNNGNGKNWCAVYIRKDGAGFDFGLCKNPSENNPPSPIYWSSTSYVLNTTYLIVLKYTFYTNSSTDDRCDLYISPALPLDPCVLSSPILTSTAGKDAIPSGIDVICLRQGDASIAPTLIIDGIRVGLSCLDFPLPVELSFFTSTVNGRDIQLNWSTKTEKNSDKFVIERMSDAAWASIGSVKAAVLSNSPKQYSFTDKNLQSGKYQYRLKMIDNDGTFEYSKAIETEVAMPKNYELSQNFPNPFNPNTVISYSLPLASDVRLIVFNSLGQTIKVLENGFKNAGNYSVNFNATELPSGTYFYKIEAAQFSQIKKMMILK